MGGLQLFWQGEGITRHICVNRQNLEQVIWAPSSQDPFPLDASHYPAYLGAYALSTVTKVMMNAPRSWTEPYPGFDYNDRRNYPKHQSVPYSLEEFAMGHFSTEMPSEHFD